MNSPTHLARVAHAAIREMQAIQGDVPPWSPWAECADGFRQEQVNIMADLIDNPDLMIEGVPYLELRASIAAALFTEKGDKDDEGDSPEVGDEDHLANPGD